MSLRVVRKSEANYKGMYHWPWLFKPEVWVVLSEDFREEEFEGSLEECNKYLKKDCPSCED